MNPHPSTIAIAVTLCTFGIGCDRDRPESDSSTYSSGEGASETIASGEESTSEADRLVKTGSDSLPEIDFALLDEARTLDFIEAKLTYPMALQDLEGRRVSLVGFMAPFDDLRNMRRCMVLPSYVGCKFCSPPSITQVVFVTQGDDGGSGSHPFIEAPCRVTGILRLSLPEGEHEGKRQGFMYSIEDAIVTPHTEATPERAPSHGNAPHQMRLPRLAPIAMSDLVDEVADLYGREEVARIDFEPVSDREFSKIVRGEIEADYPALFRADRSDAFRLLGLLPEGVDWVDALAEFQLSRRVAAADPGGRRIFILDSVPADHPYVRLERVGEIADAIDHQRTPVASGPPQSSGWQRGLDGTDDRLRAHESLRQGVRTMAIYRYARANGIPAGARPPAELIELSKDRRRGRDDIQRIIESTEFGLWEAIPGITGSFFVDSQIGGTGAFSGVEPLLARPPSTTMEVFRPRWYHDPALWRHDPVPADFADDIMDVPPVFTEVLGIGGLAPMLAQWYSFEAAKRFVGGWAGDRWALWRLSGDEMALLLETRWQDEEAALLFHDAFPDDPSWILLPHVEGSDRVMVLRANSVPALERLHASVKASVASE